MSQPSSAGQLHLDNTIGAVLIGTIIAAAMYGVTCIQTYTYFARTKKDRPILRGLVFFLWILDTLQIIFIAHTLYFYTVTNFANPAALESPIWSTIADIVVTNMISIFIRAIFVYRIWILSRSKFLTIIIIIFGLMVFGLGMANAAEFVRAGTYADLTGIAWLIYWVFAQSAFIDVLTATTLCFLLSRLRTGFTKSDSQLQTLMVYSIHTGALTSVISVICLLTYAIMPHNFVFIGFYFNLPKFFLNALLATLNARDRAGLQFDTSMQLSQIQLSGVAVHTSVSVTTHTDGAEKRGEGHGTIQFASPVDTTIYDAGKSIDIHSRLDHGDYGV